MAIRIVPLEPDGLPAMARFSRRIWNGRRPDHEDYFRWRYVEAPKQLTLMALSGDDCLGALTVFARPYRLDGQLTLCSETADWHCLPEFCGSGVGIRLMKCALEMGRPVFAVDGTPDTRQLLPRLGWKDAGQATRFVRPLRLEPLRRTVRRRLRLRNPEPRGPEPPRAPLSETLFRWLITPRRRWHPPGGTLAIAPTPVPEVLGLYDGPQECRTLPIPICEQIAWLARAPVPARRLVCLHFAVGGVLRGWALLRLEGPETAIDVTVFELFTPEPGLYSWMVAEVVHLSAGMGAHQIAALTSSPSLVRALRDCGFWPRELVPIYCWSAASGAPLQPLHLGMNVGDAALRPYPAHWSTPGAGAGR